MSSFIANILASPWNPITSLIVNSNSIPTNPQSSKFELNDLGTNILVSSGLPQLFDNANYGMATPVDYSFNATGDTTPSRLNFPIPTLGAPSTVNEMVGDWNPVDAVISGFGIYKQNVSDFVSGQSDLIDSQVSRSSSIAPYLLLGGGLLLLLVVIKR